MDKKEKIWFFIENYFGIIMLVIILGSIISLAIAQEKYATAAFIAFPLIVITGQPFAKPIIHKFLRKLQ